MRILVLAHNLRAAGGYSVGVNIIRSLEKLCVDHQVLCITPDLPDYNRIPTSSRFELSRINASSKLERLRFAHSGCRKHRDDFSPDVIFALGNNALNKPGCHQAVLLHNAHRVYDACHAGNISLVHRARRKLMDWDFSRKLQYVDLLFTQTNTMKFRVLDRWPEIKQVEVLPNAVSFQIEKSVSESICSEIERRVGGRKVFFCLARYYPHKNIESIVDCFSKYRNQLDNVACIITISETEGAGAKRILKRIEQESLADSIINVGPLPQSQIAAYYRRSSALLLPTLIESFSGTYIEAMHLKCPIITSDRDFAKEICGDAALYFSPTDSAAMLNALLQVINDKQIARNLVAKGTRQIETITTTWDSIIADALDKIEKIAGPKGTNKSAIRT